MKHITFILGGARSGKSRVGEEFALSRNLSPVYIATAEACDEEMKSRIEHHQSLRGEEWSLIEEPLALSKIITEETSPDKILFVDCLTFWLSNHLIKGTDLPTLRDDLCTSLKSISGHIILIANEVGSGIVPAHAMGRDFRDEAGRLNQDVAHIADDVYYIVAGLPLLLKKNGQQQHKLGN